MRFLYILILLVVAGAVTIFAVQNHEPVTLRYLDRELSWPVPLSLLIAAVYVLGMVSGGTVAGFLQRTWRRARAAEGFGEGRRLSSGARLLLVVVFGIVGGVLGFLGATYWGQPYHLDPAVTSPFGFVAGLLIGWSIV
jgi:uncharacterized integral membrane protein